MAKEKRTIHLTWEANDTLTLDMTGSFTVLEGLALIIAAQKQIYESVAPAVKEMLERDANSVPVTYGSDAGDVTFDDTIPNPATVTRH